MKERNAIQQKRKLVIESLEFEENILYRSLAEGRNVGAEGVIDYISKKHEMPDGRKMTHAEWFSEHYDAHEDELSGVCDELCAPDVCNGTLVDGHYEDKRRVYKCRFCDDKKRIHEILQDATTA